MCDFSLLAQTGRWWDSAKNEKFETDREKLMTKLSCQEEISMLITMQTTIFNFLSRVYSAESFCSILRKDITTFIWRKNLLWYYFTGWVLLASCPTKCIVTIFRKRNHIEGRFFRVQNSFQVKPSLWKYLLNNETVSAILASFILIKICRKFEPLSKDGGKFWVPQLAWTLNINRSELIKYGNKCSRVLLSFISSKSVL